MCLSEALPRDRLAPPLVQDEESAKPFSATLDAMACRPSWTLRNIFKSQHASPGPAKRLGGRAKINLNDYWGVLEQLMGADSLTPAPEPPVRDVDVEVDMANEINENLSNERLEVQADEERAPPQPVVVMEVEAADISASSSEQTQETSRMPTTGAPSVCRRRKQIQPPRARRVRAKSYQPPLPTPSGRSPLSTVNGIENLRHLRSPQGPRPAVSMSPLSCMTEKFARRMGRLL